ncbi:MAG: hydrolase [Nitrospiraceae bacterium]|nr:hydrolase [Nitrospiraceae bacterium]MCE5312908.1 hydrolase [Nitrospiraceae bacterium]
MTKFIIGAGEVFLIIVDVQERLAAAMQHKDRVAANIFHLVELAKMISIPMIVTEQYPKGLGSTIQELKEILPPLNILEKIAFSCCEDPAFMQAAASTGRKTAILTGMETHVCVLQTCIDLLKAGYNVHVVKDAICSRSDENWQTGIEFMRDAGAVITCTETVLFQLLKVAGTEEFKAISRRIK